MKMLELFRLYNLRKIASVRALYALLMASLLVAVAVTMCVPQIADATRKDIDATARQRVGADVKVVATSVLPPTVETALKDPRIRSVERRTVTVSVVRLPQHVGGQTVDVLAGDPSVPADGITLAQPVAEALGVGTGDRITVGDRELRVVRVERFPQGVAAQSETIGYAKVRNAAPSARSSRQILLVSTEDPEGVAAMLRGTVDGFEIRNVTEERRSLNDRLNTNLLALGALSTMCLLTTLLSMYTCIFVIIRKRLDDTAVLGLLAHRPRTVRRAFALEVRTLLAVPVLAGAALSIPLSRYALRQRHVEPALDPAGLALGTLILLVTMVLFVGPLARTLEDVEPLDVLRNQGVRRRRAWTAPLKLALLTAVALFAFATLVIKNGAVSVTSYLVILLVGVFFALTLLLTWLLTLRRPRGTLLNYTVNRIRASAASVSLSTVSMGLLMWFVLFGFGVAHVVAASFDRGHEVRLPYSSMVYFESKGPHWQELDGRRGVSAATEVEVQNGALVRDRSATSVMLGSVRDGRDDVRFTPSQGKRLEELHGDEVLVSSAFASQNHLSLGSRFAVRLSGAQPSLQVAGLYDAASLNDQLVLRRMSTPARSDATYLYLVAGDKGFADGLAHAMVVHVSDLGEVLVRMLSQYLDLFKYLTLFSALSSLLFNVNLVQLRYVNDRENAVAEAIGVPFRFLAASTAVRVAVSGLLALSGALVIYLLLASALASAVSGGAVVIPWDTYVPAIVFLVVVFAGLGLFETYLVRRSAGHYDVLRERD